MLKLDRQDLVKQLREIADAIANAPAETMQWHDDAWIGIGMIEFRRPHASNSLYGCRLQIDFMVPSGRAGEAAKAVFDALGFPDSQANLQYPTEPATR